MTKIKNIALEKALQSFDAVEKNYVHALEARGLKFAPRSAHQARTRELRQALAAREGVAFRNAGASISAGWLSKACVECTGCGGSQTFSTTLKCHRDCYFCFNHNLKDYQQFFDAGCPWQEELDNCYKTNKGKLAAMAVSGGEPLMVLDNSIALIKRAREMFPGVHTRMYTSGDLLTPAAAKDLNRAGLQEIRFSVKLEDAADVRQRVLENMKMAGDYIEDVMVEMPIIPLLDSGKPSAPVMQELMQRFQDANIRGMNLLEFCFPFHNWPEFERRGFSLKNPPFPVMCDYSYSGGLAVSGSEEAALELMLWALDAGITFGLHYCSLENKHRSEMLQANAGAEKVHPIFDFDKGDYFIKCAKVFGEDCEVAQRALEAAGCNHVVRDEEEQSLSFPRVFLPAITKELERAKIDITPAISTFTMAQEGNDYFLREVALTIASNDTTN